VRNNPTYIHTCYTQSVQLVQHCVTALLIFNGFVKVACSFTFIWLFSHIFTFPVSNNSLSLSHPYKILNSYGYTNSPTQISPSTNRRASCSYRRRSDHVTAVQPFHFLWRTCLSITSLCEGGNTASLLPD
jgi:hypothetical protein